MFDNKLPPQLFALVSHEGEVKCAPAMGIGAYFTVFVNDADIEILSFIHRDNALTRFKIMEGSEDYYKEFQNSEDIYMLYSLVSDVLVAPTYKRTPDLSTKNNTQHLINFLIYMCQKIKGRGVSDFFIHFELQKWVTNALIESEMTNLIMDLAPISHQAIVDYAKETNISYVQNKPEPSTDDLIALFSPSENDEEEE